MKKHEVIALCFMVAGGALQVIASMGDESPALRGVGIVALIFGIAIELVGIAILEDDEKRSSKK
jgi:hypothetical protein